VPAKDRYHDAVVRALTRDGWIVDEQYTVIVEPRVMYIDIHAIHRSRNQEICVEIKGFRNMPSELRYLESTVGQYVLYRAALNAVNLQFPLYLAVPHTAYDGILSEPIGQSVIQYANISVMLFNLETEEVVEWIP
jgi:hypothetical protein